MDCPEGMVYQQCRQACPQTCDTDKSLDCIGGCIEGCFCPSGKVLFGGNCINETECEGMYTKYYMYLQFCASKCLT